MKITKHDLLAPANFISLAGLVLTIIGSLDLETSIGFTEVAVGRILDMLDGPVARRTHTSRFGAVLDASIDKLSILAIVTGLLAYDLAPTAIVLYVLLQNGTTAIINSVASHRHIVIHSSLSGKRNIFFQITTMLLFAGSHQLTGVVSMVVTTAAYLTLLASIYYAVSSMVGYYSILSSARKHKSQP